jgi:hypothetical protein
VVGVSRYQWSESAGISGRSQQVKVVGVSRYHGGRSQHLSVVGVSTYQWSESARSSCRSLTVPLVGVCNEVGDKGYQAADSSGVSIDKANRYQCSELRVSVIRASIY